MFVFIGIYLLFYQESKLMMVSTTLVHRVLHGHMWIAYYLYLQIFSLFCNIDKLELSYPGPSYNGCCSRFQPCHTLLYLSAVSPRSSYAWNAFPSLSYLGNSGSNAIFFMTFPPPHDAGYFYVCDPSTLGTYLYDSISFIVLELFVPSSTLWVS